MLAHMKELKESWDLMRNSPLTYYKNKTLRKRNCLNKKDNIYMFRNQLVFNTATFDCNFSNGYQK